MSFICNLGKGIGLRRERSNCSPTDEFTFPDVTVCSARNKSAKGSRWLLSLSKMGAGCQKTACCCYSEEFSPLPVVLFVACLGLAAAGGETDQEPLWGWQGEKGPFCGFHSREIIVNCTWLCELFQLVPLVSEKLVAFPLNIKVALWIDSVNWRGREKEMQLSNDREAEKT